MSGHTDNDLLQQYEALQSKVGWVDLSDRDQIEVRGGDRTSFLHNFCTNDIEGLSAGQGCEAFFTSVQGKVVGHGFIFCGPEALVIETMGGHAGPLIGHLDRYLIQEDVSFVDRSDAWSELLLAGPGAAPLLEQLTGTQMPNESLRHVEAAIGGQLTSIRRVEIVRPDSFLVSLDANAAPSIAPLLRDAGALECFQAALNVCRLEAGWPNYGSDITDQNLAQEVGRNRQAISFTKGCYLGQETVARIDALGHVNKLLVGLKLDGSAVPESGTKIQVDGKEVGEITSAAYSPSLQAPLAMAYVRRGHHQIGMSLPVAGATAEVIELPLS